jgi:hypothetical protein
VWKCKPAIHAWKPISKQTLANGHLAPNHKLHALPLQESLALRWCKGILEVILQALCQVLLKKKASGFRHDLHRGAVQQVLEPVAVLRILRHSGIYDSLSLTRPSERPRRRENEDHLRVHIIQELTTDLHRFAILPEQRLAHAAVESLGVVLRW